MSRDITRILDRFNLAAPGADTDIEANELIPAEGVTIFRIQFSPTVATVLNIMETRSGTTFAGGLNSSAAVGAGDVAIFDVLVSDASTYNFQIETNGIIRQLKVAELRGTV